MVHFSKMHGAGNDFVVINGIAQRFDPRADLIAALCDRHFGIGADQLLLIEPATGDADFTYRIFNCDGSEVEMCGNGARCFALFVYERGLTNKRTIVARTRRRNVTMHLLDDGQVAVEMGTPELALCDAQFDRSSARATEVQGRDLWQIVTAQGTFTADLIAFGNPHAVVLSHERPSRVVLERCGRAIETASAFPERINVEFLTIVNPELAWVDVWERGSGITLACGSGACAAAVSGQLRGLLSPTVRLQLPGGELTVSWDGDPEHSVSLKGPASFVFDGVVDAEALVDKRLKFA